MTPFPLINGVRFDFSSVEIHIGAEVFNGIKEITYKHTLDPGMMRGTRAAVMGRTRGKYDPEASITFYKSEYQDFIAAIGNNYMLREFNVTVIYQELPALELVTDNLLQCRLKSSENSHSEGEDALVVKCDLSIMRILESGLDPVLEGPSTLQL